MKRGLFVALAVGVLHVSAQQQIPSAPKSIDQAAPYTKHSLTGDEMFTTQPTLPSSKKSAVALTTVGETYYDLQSNGSVDNRIEYNSTTGQVAVAWTTSLGADPYNDRGTGYNFYNSTTWGAKPTARVESIRTGWPSLVHTSVSEFIVSHTATNLATNIRATAGFGSWTENTTFASTTTRTLWPRAAAGGPSNKTVHIIAITAPTGNSGTVYKGFDGALMYYRSTDGGFTWGIKDSLLPGIDTADHYGFSGDRYAIDAHDSIVAVAVFNDFESSFLLKSTDNGDTWTRTEFWTTGLKDYDAQAAGTVSDVNNDAVIDTVVSSDNSGDVLIDNNGLVHVFFGRQRYLDDDPLLDAGSSYFPFTNGIFYWNENSTIAETITGALDLDSDGQLGITANSEIAQYFQSLSTFPTAGVDSNNNIFLTYSALNELEYSGSQFYNKVYAMSSRDGGTTWSNPMELTAGIPGVECVFPSLAREVDDKFRVLFQLDGEPGLTVRGDEDPPGLNELILLDVDTNTNVSLNEFDINKGEVSSMYPNPATDKVYMNVSVKLAGEYTIEISNIAGVMVKRVDLGNMATGLFQEAVDVENLEAGVYIVSLRSGEYTSSKRLVIQ